MFIAYIPGFAFKQMMENPGDERRDLWCGIAREKNGEALARNAVKTHVRIFTEKMRTVYRDIPWLLTSRDTVICRLNIVHGIVVNVTGRI